MHRNIEQILDSHRRADTLRKAGKPIWSKTIDIRSIIHEDRENQSVEHIADVAVRIAKLIRSKVPTSTFDVTTDDYDRDLDEAIEDLESYTATSLQNLRDEGDNITEMFNWRLNDIYDWADRERVWLG